MKSPTGCAIVVYLLIKGTIVTREQVADLLWDASTAQGLKRLRSLLNRLRAHLPPEIKIGRTSLHFQPTPSPDIDWFILKNALAAHDDDRLVQALSVYKGELLNGFYLQDAPRFNEWVTVERENVRQQVRAACRHLFTTYFDAEQFVESAEIARRWLALDQFDEEPHRALMQALAADGDIPAAIEQFEQCRRLLWEELSTEPEPATLKLAEQIAQLPTKFAALPPPTRTLERWNGEQLPEPTQLPVHSIIPHRRNSDFVGRSKDLLETARHLLLHNQPSTVPIVAISGIGGIGKTQLAVEFAFRFGRYFAGVYWLSFARPDSIANEIASIGGERGLRLFRDDDQLTIADRVARVQQAWQEETPRLLIFDNCEDEALLKQWLPVTGDCRILLTTQRGSWARELGVVVHPLAHLSRADSVLLLQQLVGRSAPPGRLDEIAAELGDLPLALHLAGSFLHRYRSVTVDQYLDQIGQNGLLDHPSLRGRGTSQSPTNHELNVARTFELNFARLNPDNDVDAIALKLLTNASCFALAEPIPRDLLLETVLGAEPRDLMAELLAEDGLFHLIGLGFLNLAQHDSVIMHRLVASFTLAQDETRTASARTAVEDTMATLLLRTNLERGRLAVLPVSASHIKAILRPGLERGSTEAARLATWWGTHLIHSLLPDRALPYLERALEIIGERDDSDLAYLCRQMGTALWQLNNDTVARTYYERAYLIHRAIYGDEHIETAHDLHNIAILYSRSGDHEAALTRYHAAIAIYERNGNVIGAARAHRNLGLVYNRLNDLDAAKAQYSRALALFEDAVTPRNTNYAMTLRSLALIELRRREPASSLNYTRRAMEIDRELIGESSVDWARNLVHEGAALGMLGDVGQGLELAQAGLSRIEALRPGPLYLGYALLVLGQLHRLNRDLATARSYAERAFTMLNEILPTSWETQDAAALLAVLDADDA